MNSNSDIARAEMTIDHVIAVNLRRYRKARNLSIRKVCERVNELGVKMSHPGVLHREQGKTRVTMAELFVLAYALETSVARLLEFKDGETVNITIDETLADNETLSQWIAGKHELPKQSWAARYFAKLER